MKPAQFTNRLRASSRITSWLIYTLFAGMMVCLMSNLVRVAQAYFPSVNFSYLPVIGFLLVFEAVYVHKQRHRVMFPDWDWFLFHIAEWVVFILVVRLAVYLTGGLDQLIADLPAYRLDFWRTFFNPEVILGLLSVVFVWIVSVWLVNILQYLEDDIDLIEIEAETGLMIDRAATRRQMANLILAVGTTMVILTSWLRFSGNFQAGAGEFSQSGVIEVLVYFILGFTLLSLTQLSILRIRWVRGEFIFQRQLTRRWAIYSLIFLFMVGMISILLPTNYTLSLITVLQVGLSWLVSLFLFLYWLLSIPLLFFSQLIALLAGRQRTDIPPETIKMPEVPPAPGIQPSEVVPFLEILKSFLFWGGLLTLVFISLAYYFKLRQPHLQQLRFRPYALWLAEWWQRLHEWLGGMNKNIRQSVARSWERFNIRPTPRQKGGWTRFRGIRQLNPRQVVLYYYLALVRRGSESGIPRQPSETPLEYTNHLQHAMRATPSAELPVQEENGEFGWEREIEVLTADFMEARYSKHPIKQEQSSRARRLWKHLNKLMRKKI